MEKINLLFWQNCVSPHQLPYIKELHNDIRVNNVILIAPVWDLAEREKMGWGNNIKVDGVEIIIAPNEISIKNLFFKNQQNSVHLFSGIRADKFVYGCFKHSLKYNVKRGLITEPPFDFKIPLILHKIRFLLLDYKYIKKIDYVFAMGDKAVDYYNFWSKKWNVFIFGYCVSLNNTILPINNIDKLRFVYVGSLIKLKNVMLIVNALNNISKDENVKLDIIGDGSEYENLRKQVEILGLQNDVSFLGKMPMKQVHLKLNNYDVLVMPSIRDGWGAVINEGLQSGLFIVSSDNCGAKTLIVNSDRGLVFKNKDVDSLTDALKYCISHSVEIKNSRQKVLKWSDKINGTSMSKYMLDCLLKNETVIPPWKK